MYDFQKPNMWKRISAALLDFFLVLIVATGAMLLVSTVIGYDDCSRELQQCYDSYEAEYGVSFRMSGDEYNALSSEDKEKYTNAVEAFTTDENANYLCAMLINMTLIVVTLGLLFAFAVTEVVIPLIFKNGQTVGKKIFGIGVMREDGVRLSAVQLFARTILGKLTVETLVPVFLLIMIYFGIVGVVGYGAIAVLLIVQLVLLVSTKARTPIHDKMARSVTVDLQSQMIFDSEQELLEYVKKKHAEEAEKAEWA